VQLGSRQDEYYFVEKHADAEVGEPAELQGVQTVRVPQSPAGALEPHTRQFQEG